MGNSASSSEEENEVRNANIRRRESSLEDARGRQVESLRLKLIQRGIEASGEELRAALVAADNNVIDAMSRLLSKSGEEKDKKTGAPSSPPVVRLASYADALKAGIPVPSPMDSSVAPKGRKRGQDGNDVVNSLQAMDKPKRARNSLSTEEPFRSMATTTSSKKVTLASPSVAEAPKIEEVSLGTASKEFTKVDVSEGLSLLFAKLQSGLINWGSVNVEEKQARVNRVGWCFRIPKIDSMTDRKKEITLRLFELFDHLDGLKGNPTQQKAHVKMVSDRIADMREGLNADINAIWAKYRLLFGPLAESSLSSSAKAGEKQTVELPSFHDAELDSELQKIGNAAEALAGVEAELNWIAQQRDEYTKQARVRLKSYSNEVEGLFKEKETCRKKLAAASERKKRLHGILLQELRSAGLSDDLGSILDAVQGVNDEVTRANKARRDAVASEVISKKEFVETHAKYLTLSSAYSVMTEVGDAVGCDFHGFLGSIELEIKVKGKRAKESIGATLDNFCAAAYKFIESRMQSLAAAELAHCKRSEDLLKHRQLFGSDAPESERQLDAMVSEMKNLRDKFRGSLSSFQIYLKSLAAKLKAAAVNTREVEKLAALAQTT